jgi:hypothetical protein
MTSLVVTKIKHDVKRNHLLSERDANILFATLEAQEKRIAKAKSVHEREAQEADIRFGRCENQPADVRDLLKRIPTAEYPADLLAARRAAFIRQIDPSDCSDIETDGVTEADDERNSRPSPF